MMLGGLMVEVVMKLVMLMLLLLLLLMPTPPPPPHLQVPEQLHGPIQQLLLLHVTHHLPSQHSAHVPTITKFKTRMQF